MPDTPATHMIIDNAPNVLNLTLNNTIRPNSGIQYSKVPAHVTLPVTPEPPILNPRPTTPGLL